jgi:pimeloyl-ACP methyl ester carboxylesterase
MIVLAIALAAAAAGAACVLLTAAQRALLFPGSSAVLGAAEMARFGGRGVWLEHAGGRSEAWLLPPLRASDTPGALLVYAHGNGELIDHWIGAFEAPRRLGVSVLLVEYPGYGRSPGRTTQASVEAAMRAAYDFAVAEPGVDPRRIVAYGRSLGGGAACALAREREVAALVLESSFTSIRDMARELRMPGFLVRDPFDNVAVLRAFRGPVLLLHGERDEVIPVEHAVRLRAAAPGAELHVLPCGHNDCERPWALIERFLAANGLI